MLCGGLWATCESYLDILTACYHFFFWLYWLFLLFKFLLKKGTNSILKIYTKLFMRLPSSSYFPISFCVSELFSTRQRPWCFVTDKALWFKNWFKNYPSSLHKAPTFDLLSGAISNHPSLLQLVNVWFSVLPGPTQSSQKERTGPPIPYYHYCSIGSLTGGFGFSIVKVKLNNSKLHAVAVFAHFEITQSYDSCLVLLVYADDTILTQYFKNTF